MHYRRSPHLLVQWQGRQTVLVQCDSQRRFAVDQRLLAVLSQLDAWTAPGDVAAFDAEIRPEDWERLLEMGVIEGSDTVHAERDGAAPLWTPFELAVHRQSNRGGARPVNSLPVGETPPAAFKPRGAGDVTALPPPDLDLPAPFGEVLDRRRSLRRYADRPLRLEELSTLLHHAARVQEVFRDGAYGECVLRPSPSGGARSELELYVIASDVDGLCAGAHHYDPRRHQLVEVRRRDEHLERLLRWVHATTGDVLNRDPPAMLLVTAVFARVMWKYRDIGLSLVYKDTGCLLQTLYLVATAMGLAPCAVGGGEEAANSRWLGLDPLEESQVGLFMLGPRGKASEATPETPGEPVRSIAQLGGRPAELRSPDRIMRMAQGFLASAVLRAALQLGVFDSLAAGAASAATVAATTHTDVRGARILLDALTALGLAEVNGRDYTLTPLSSRFLVRDGDEFVGPLIDAYADDVLWEALRLLPAAVRRGGTPLDDHVAGAGHPYWQRLAAARRVADDPAPREVAAMLSPVLERTHPLRVLDIGCGNGAMGYALVLRHDDAVVSSLESAAVLEVARQHAQQLGVTDRVRFIDADMTKAALGGPYDVVLLSQVLHNLTVGESRALLRRSAGALAPGGVLVVVDMLREAPPREEPAPYLLSVITLAWTPGGEVRSRGELEALLDEAGLRVREANRVPGAGTWLLIAEPRGAGRAR